MPNEHSSIQQYPYRNPDLPVESRLEDLLNRMTLEEKVAQMGGSFLLDLLDDDHYCEDNLKQKIEDMEIGALHNFNYDDPKLTMELQMETVNAVQRYLVEQTRLGIPAMITAEGVHGHWAHNATVFPHAIAMASTWNPELIRQMAEVVAREARATGVSQLFSPNLDLAREPRWGRVQETYGEDPYLVTQMGMAYIRGAQGSSRPCDGEHCATTVKHFVAHGSPESGINISPVSVGPREVEATFLRPFEVAVKEGGALCVMPAYHEIDGMPLACHRHYLTEVLKQRWGFQGYTYSDWGSVGMLHTHHRVAPSLSAAGKQALASGLDMEAPRSCWGKMLLHLANTGAISVDHIDDAVRRILRVKFLLGLFEHPYADMPKAVAVRNSNEHRAIARQAAQESIILLKNEDHLLPLDGAISSIAVIGPNADVAQLGNYSGWNDNLVTPLAGIQHRVAAGVSVVYARGCGLWESDTSGFAEAVDAARQCDVAVVVVGESTVLCTEGTDTNDLALAGVQLDLVKAVQATGTPTIVVLVNGRPLAIPWIAEHVPAILELWFGGEEQGNALADVLFGDVNPSGKLTVSLPRSTGHLPAFYNKKPSALGYYQQPGTFDKPGRDYALCSPTPLFAFGHGLSYTTFNYSHLGITPEVIDSSGEVTVSVTVTNTGQVRGAEVVQLYLTDVYSSVEIPVRQLRGFDKVWLNPGEERVIRFHLGADDMALVDWDMQRVVEPGEFTVSIGGLTGTFEVA